jgi:CheY-like chemotaxis protein
MEIADSAHALVRVVLVEDDPLLLCSFADSLRELGYDVRETTDPAEALRWIERDGADALFTDINMPGMDGRDLAAKARRSAPKLRVVFATGYSVAKVPDLDDARYLRKPFAPEDMRKALEDAQAPIGTV